MTWRVHPSARRTTLWMCLNSCWRAARQFAFAMSRLGAGTRSLSTTVDMANGPGISNRRALKPKLRHLIFMILTNCNWCLFPLVVKCSLKPPDRMYLRNSCTIESTLAMAPCSRLVPSLSEPTKRITNGLSTWRSTFHGPYDKQTHKQPNNKNNTNYESPLPENSIFIKNFKV